MATLAVKQLQLAPLGAGDLIDRTVRLYRRHFMALVRASAPPVVASAAGAIVMSISVRSMGATEDEGRLLIYVLLSVLGLAVYLAGLLAQLVILGGASRNLVMHLLWGEPVTTRLIYRSVRSRFKGLLLATLAVGLWLIISFVISLMVAMVVLMVAMVLVGILFAVLVSVPWLMVIIGLVLYVSMILILLFVFFMLAGLAAYVPQVIMVEGKGVMDSIGRSVELARGHVRRLVGMFLFTTFATYSAIMLLLVPLGWIGYLNGVNPFSLDASQLPAWYSISYEVITQLGVIVLAPVWMMGLSLLYVDQRVRHEGYDIELLAALRFGDMPAVPEGLNAPLSPALAAPTPATPAARAGDKFPGSTLGLDR